MKLVHLVGFIENKFVTMHGHVNVKLSKTVEVSCSALADIISILRTHLGACLALRGGKRRKAVND